MFKLFLNLFRKPSARVLAQAELEDAQRHELAARSAAEYANSQSTYHAARITRLQAYLRAPN